METKNTSPWFLLTGLILGLAIGLIIALLILPVEQQVALPAELSPAAKAEYRLMIARAYQTNTDLLRSQSRLELLADPDLVSALTAQAQALFAEDGADADARALAELAEQLEKAAH
jgi:uncharacterized membrane-anchored protein YhcB (DUF1043 family)